MRKIVLLTLSIFFAALIAGCDNNKSAETDKSALTVACTEITETILSPALPLLKEQGLNVKLVIVDNNVNVIQAVNDGSVDAGLGVHIKFMENVARRNFLDCFAYNFGLHDALKNAHFGQSEILCKRFKRYEPR
jgi:D-methionine transport system substrate-binding protein